MGREYIGSEVTNQVQNFDVVCLREVLVKPDFQRVNYPGRY
jgi:hypothetical protein